MGILTLPSELLYRIGHDAQPYDFESLVLASKRLHDVLQPLLAEHNERRKRYRHFTFDKEQGPECIVSVPELLMEIALDPAIAHYIVHLDMSNRSPLDEDDEKVEKLQENSDKLRLLLERSSYLAAVDNGDEFIDEWLEKILDETCHYDQEVDYANAFLLTLLPNVQTLQPSAHWKHYSTHGVKRGQAEDDDELARRVPDLMQLIVKRANNHSRTGQSLSQLRTIYPTVDVDAQFGADMLAIIPFLALDSLHQVFDDSGFCEVQDVVEQQDDEDDDDDDDDKDVLDSDGNYEGEREKEEAGKERNEDEDEDEDEDNGGNNPIDHQIRKIYQDRVISWRYPVLGRNIESMCLRDYVIDDKACAVLFRDMKKLRHLQMEYSMKDGYGFDWNLQRFIDNLGVMVGDNLEVLHLTANQLVDNTSLIRNSMRRFIFMKSLTLTTTFFVKRLGSASEDFHEPIEPLVNILPKTLHEFTLYVPCVHHERLGDLFEHFKANRGTKLPLLNKVTLKIISHDCWMHAFPEYEEQRAIIERFAAEQGLDVVAV